jgi:hypothetical protein
MTPVKTSIPRSEIYALILTVLISLSLIGCGGGSITANVAEGGSGGTSANPPSGSSGSNGAAPTPGPKGTTLSNLHQRDGWTGFALLRSDNYQICQSCDPNGPEATWAMVQGISSPSLTGNSTQFDIGGTTPFTDILWNNHLIGDFSSQGLNDSKKTLIPTLHHFIYEAYFFGSDLALSQAVEFDINQFFNGKSFIWGHECRIAGGHEWDTWDNAKQIWVPSGVACNPKENEWNHVVIEVERTSDDRLLFKSITLNDQKAVINRYDNPTPKQNWYGVTINYQQDGDRNQAPYSIWLDKVNFTYW